KTHESLGYLPPSAYRAELENPSLNVSLVGEWTIQWISHAALGRLVRVPTLLRANADITELLRVILRPNSTIIFLLAAPFWMLDQPIQITYLSHLFYETADDQLP